MKIFATCFFIFLLCTSLSGQKDSPVFFSPIIGIKYQTDGFGNGGLRTLKPLELQHTPTFGLEIQLPKWRSSLSYLTSFHYRVEDLDDLYEHYSWIGEFKREQIVQFQYQLKYIKLGVGYLWFKHHHRFSGKHDLRTRKGISTSISLPIARFDISYRYDLLIKRFSPFDTPNHSISFLYRLNQKNGAFSSLDKTNKVLGINFYAGIRLASYKDLNYYPHEYKPNLGFSPSFDMEIIWKPMNLSINLQKDLYMSFNTVSGDLRRTIKAHIVNTVYMLKYHRRLSNSRLLKFGLGGAFTYERELLKDILLNSTDENLRDKSLNYQVKSIGLSTSYEIFNRTELDIRFLVPYFGLKQPLARRISLGLHYRFF